MKMSVLLCLLLWSLVEVHSQTEFPYVSFRGETLPNHVDLTLVGEDSYGDPGSTVRCHTDLNTSHVVVVSRVYIVETGISLMELDCHSLTLILILMRLVDFNE